MYIYIYIFMYIYIYIYIYLYIYIYIYIYTYIDVYIYIIKRCTYISKGLLQTAENRGFPLFVGSILYSAVPKPALSQLLRLSVYSDLKSSLVSPLTGLSLTHQSGPPAPTRGHLKSGGSLACCPRQLARARQPSTLRNQLNQT